MGTSGRTVAVAVALLTAAGASPVHAGLVPATSTGDVPGPSTSSSALAMPASATLATAVPVPLPARRSSPLSQSAQASLDEAAPVVVASKPFAESYVLAEIFAQLLEARGIEVDRRFGLGGTEIAFRALREGAIDLYPEYTGTGLAAILGEVLRADAETLYRYVVQTFRERWDVRWLAPLGFENTYAMAVRRETAERLGLRTLSDLAREAGQLRAGFTPDFIGRSDGLPGLREAYGFEPAEVHPLLQAIKYEALVESGVDVIDGYSTDGLIARYDLVVLEDNLRFFPPYQAAALTNGDFWSRRPDAIAALSELSGLLGVERMREWNRRAEEDGEPVSDIARDALAEIGLVVTDRAEVTGPAPDEEDGFAAYMWRNRIDLLLLVRRHLLLVVVSLGAAALLAIPAGLLLVRAAGGAEGVIRGIGVVQTIPSIALLAFMIPALGIGVAPAVVALFLYSLFPILRNTYTGVRDANPAAVDAARALGMTPAQLLRHVRLPLAAPVIMAGLRTAAVINVGTATIAAFIGAGGLGDPIVAGLALSDTQMILSGAVPAAALAMLVDAGLALAERWRLDGGARRGVGGVRGAGPLVGCPEFSFDSPIQPLTGSGLTLQGYLPDLRWNGRRRRQEAPLRAA